MKQKPPKTHRDDLTCTVCGGTFAGHIASKYCPDCKEARKREEAAEELDPPTGSEMDVEATPPDVPKRDPSYQKKIHVDPERERYDARRRRQGDRDGARGKALDALSKETTEERERKDPLRKTLAELRAEREGLTAEVNRIEGQILQVLSKLGTPQADEPPLKKCFGRFDAGDFECTSLCPVQPECEVQSDASTVGTAGSVQAPAASRETSEATAR